MVDNNSEILQSNDNIEEEDNCMDPDEVIESYARFEREAMYDIHEENHKSAIKNLIIYDGNSNLACVDRLRLNLNDGYIENFLVQSKYNPQAKNIIKMQNIGSSIYDVAMPRNKIGQTVDFHFSTYENYDSLFYETFATDYFKLDAPINPEYNMITNNRVYTVNCFKDFEAFCYHNGIIHDFLWTLFLQFTYFIHEVVNCLLPKEIVLIADSYKGINIAKYTPMVNARMIPDMKNKLDHVITLLKGIATGESVYVNVGTFHVKFTITPLISTINFVYIKTGGRFMISMPTLYNSITEWNSEYVPGGNDPYIYMTEMNPYWHNARNHNKNIDAYLTLQGDCLARLEGYNNERDLHDFLQLEEDVTLVK